VIGGGDIYAQVFALATRLEITRVHARPDGETVFPPLDPAQWRETARRGFPAGPDDETSFDVLTFVRVPSAAQG
jgi:dihydrofolate reductase